MPMPELPCKLQLLFAAAEQDVAGLLQFVPEMHTAATADPDTRVLKATPLQQACRRA